jgi:carbon storage regulator CsrA
MLILSRMVGETIEIPSLGVKVMITEMRPSQRKVKVGIEAPDSAAIYRGELLDELRDQEDTPCHYST